MLLRTGDSAALARHPPACFFQPFTATGHTNAFQIRHLHIKLHTQLPHTWGKSILKCQPPQKPAHSFGHRLTPSGLPTPVKMLAAGSIWPPAAADSGMPVTSISLGWGVPGGSQPHVPPGGQLCSWTPLCPDCGAQVRCGCFRMKQQSTVISKGLISA